MHILRNTAAVALAAVSATTALGAADLDGTTPLECLAESGHDCLPGGGQSNGREKGERGYELHLVAGDW